MKKEPPLLPIVQKYFEQDPSTASHTLETMGPAEAADVLKNIPTELAVEAFHHLNDAFAAVVLPKLPASLFRKIINTLDPQQAANIFSHLPQKMRQNFFVLLDENKHKQIQELLTYPDDSAGRIMKLDFVTFHSDVKVKEAIHRIRVLAQKSMPSSYIYVLDKESRLIGILNMRDILLADENEFLETVMRRDVFMVHCFDDREKVANELLKHKFFAAPVVDNEHRLLGIVHAEQLIGDVQEEASEDIQKMFGAGGDERTFSPVWFSLRTRLPWLYFNLGTAFLAASVVSHFQDIIARISVLAVFLPVIAGQGGNAGNQALAIVMRGLVMREIPPNRVRQLILKEAFIGIVNGIAIGTVTGLIAWAWKGNPVLGLVVSLGMLCNLIVAGFTGAAIPLSMKALGMDPAQCSSMILTTFTDVMGFFSFLGFAVLFQNYLM